MGDFKDGADEYRRIRRGYRMNSCNRYMPARPSSMFFRFGGMVFAFCFRLDPELFRIPFATWVTPGESRRPSPIVLWFFVRIATAAGRCNSPGSFRTRCAYPRVGVDLSFERLRLRCQLPCLAASCTTPAFSIFLQRSHASCLVGLAPPPSPFLRREKKW